MGTTNQIKNKCLKHPKYSGNKMPRNNCVECLKLYKLLGGFRRIPTAKPSKIMCKTKFTRKVKHKRNIVE